MGLAASIGVRAQTNFQKSYKQLVASFGNENNQGQILVPFASENGYELTRMLFGGGFRPKRFAQASKSGAIG
jgi:hypothetical protein